MPRAKHGCCAGLEDLPHAELLAYAQATERDLHEAHIMLEALPTWGSYAWREAAASVALKLREYSEQVVLLMRERDEALEDARAARRERDEAIRTREAQDTEAQHRATQYCKQKREAERELDVALAEVERLKGAVAEMTRDLRKLAGDDNLPASSAAVVAMARIQTLNGQRDEARKTLAALPTWGSYDWDKGGK